MSDPVSDAGATAAAVRRGALIPGERLGALLRRSRSRQRRTLTEVARRVEGWTPSELAEVERGEGITDDAAVGDLLDAYGVGPWRATRRTPALVLDRSVVATDGEMCGLREATLRLAALGEVWGVAPDDASVDAVMAEWSGTDGDEVKAARDAVMGHRDEVERWIDDAGQSLVVPAAGIAIGGTPVGSLTLVVSVRSADPDAGGRAAAPSLTLRELRSIRSRRRLRA